MGRRRKNPNEQKARGYPGKRRKAVDRAIAEAERLAELLASAPGRDGDPLSPPAYIGDERMKPAMRVWEEYAPHLQRTRLLDSVDRHSFAIFCVYMAEFLAAHDDVLRNGYSTMVKTISKDRMPRENPAVSRRDNAVKVILEFSKRFGLTPLDRYALLKDQFGVRDWLPGAGGEDDLLKRAQKPSDEKAGAAPAPAPAPAPAAPAEADPLGILNQFDSPPPGRPN
jgi:P27 family predicted phage terminase small subunit